MKGQNHMIISIDAEAFGKMQHPFMMLKNSQNKVDTRECTSTFNKGRIWDSPTADSILNGEKLKAFPLRAGTREGCPFSPLLFNIVLEILATAIKQEKK